MEDAPEYPLQEDGTSQLKRSSVEDAEVPELSCLTSNKLRNDGHQFMEHRVDQGRSVSPTPSYLSMKSEQSMSKPINFKEQDRTQEEIVQLERSGSPTPSCVSMRSDSSMKKPINFRDGGSTERVSEGLCDPCSDDDTERRAVKFCPTCTLSYCEKHVRRHYTSAVYKTHTLVDVAEEVRSLGEERLQKPNSINVLPPPGEIRFLSVKSDSVTLRWGSPEGLEGPKIFRVTCEGDGEQRSLKVKDINKVEVTGLQPGQKYKFSVATEGDHGNQSECVSASTYTVVPPPGNMKVERSGAASFNLRWSKAPGMEHVPQQFLITCASPEEEPLAIHTDHCYRTLTELQPGVQYTFGVSTVLMNEQHSIPVSTTINTGVPVPDKLTVVSVDPTSATLSWEPPGGMDQTQLQYQVSYQCPGGEQHTTTTSSVSITLSDLRPASEYSVSVCSLLDNGQKSLPVSQTFTTNINLMSVLENLGLGHCLETKLTIQEVRQIGDDTVLEKVSTDLPSQVKIFLKRLLMANMTARGLHSNRHSHDQMMADATEDLNPSDLITALFLCSDGILQQELSLKMSLCQFAVPLLLPNPDTQQSTLMLWAMRDIVKQFRSHSPDDKNEFVDKSIVCTELPMISFVRLGSSSLSKSKFLNEVLGNSQQTNNTFVHHNMTGGNIPRQISDGLVEMSWYLPSGNPHIDIFNEPVAVVNLRGDLQSHETEFAFLCQTSAAVLVFCDDLLFDSHILSLQSMKKPVFIVCNYQSESHNEDSFRKLAAQLKTNCGQVIKKTQRMNDADLVTRIRSAVKDVLKSNPFTIKVERMADVAHDLGIPVDEDYGPCQKAKSKAETFINISDISKYKDSQLPLQGLTWKELTILEKEGYKLKNISNKTTDEYKNELMQDKEKQRMIQMKTGMSQSIKYFIEGLESSDEERSYFLKWMKINLDELSRTQLSKLRKKYRDICQKSPEKKDLISNLDRQISNSSLGTEHFFREVGQLYEASMFFAEATDLKKEVQDLPKICAELMLAGFPLEIMDGDASNIPITWITEVLKELDSLTTPNNKIRVVTVLGSQSSGKSTLLNTLFGVQFAVSSGRCTRGAFMQLIKVKQDFRDVIKCDFIMIIDTEGLKAVELSHLTDNCEHDNELATLVVGLSDFSIVNIAMENNSDVRDLLQIVAHAFLRMRESGRRPTCQFVHQNVTDVSAPDKNQREQNILLEQLNEMTSVASKMENIDECKFTDIIIYKPEENCNIPGLWHGSPPMAPVNEGYSAAVSKLKQQLINTFINQTADAQILPDFCKWLQVLWTAIQHEKFIFSFRNSLMAEAYNNLCVEFNKWEWNFQMQIYKWLNKTEIRVANYGLNTSEEMSGLNSVLLDLKSDADHELEREGEVFLNNIQEYFKSQKGNVHLIEKHKEDFKINAESQIKMMKSTVKRKLEVAIDVRRCAFGVDKIKKHNRDAMDMKVTELVKKCNKGDKSMTAEEIEQEFEKMWNKTVKELSFGGLEHQTVATNIYGDLKCNLEREGPTVWEMLKEAHPIDKYENEEFKEKKEKHSVTRFFKETLTKGGEKIELKRKNTQEVASEIIDKCKTFIEEKLKQRIDYHCTHFRELLEIIEENLNQQSDLHISAENAAALKIHISGYAAREFQKMHEVFIQENDPQQNLEKFKPLYLADLKDLYCKKDLSRRKTDEFTNLCVKPAVKAYINKHLGKYILEEALTNCNGVDFSSRRSFQFSIMKHLISADFSTFQRYTDCYDGFSYEFILNAMVRHFSEENSSIAKIEVGLLEEICKEIQRIVSQKLGSDENDLTFTQFLQDLSLKLSSVLVIPNDTTGLNLETSKTKEFSTMFLESITIMEKCLMDEFCSDKDVLAKLSGLPDPPQDQLHSKIIGCGEQCPWCQAPCDVEGKLHTQHSALIHRPKGLGGYTVISSGKLQTQTCVLKKPFTSELIHMNTYQKLKQNRSRWNSQPFNSTVSNYWKFLFGKHNEEYAENHSALPADIPDDWKVITSEQALKSLKEKYYPETEAE